MARPVRALAFALAVAGATVPATAASSHREFDGTVVHVSDTSLKVHGVEGGKAQTLGFTGNFRHRSYREGQYVRVIFDQKLLGLRHADQVISDGGMRRAKH